jgi:hypothetical protein
MSRIQGDFVGHVLGIVEAGEPRAREIPIRPLVPLHRHQARRELPAEQLAVEVVVSGV